MEHLTKGALAPAPTKSRMRGARRGALAFVAALVMIGGGVAPAALAAEPDALISPVTITPDHRYGSLLTRIGSDSLYTFVDGGLDLSVNQQNSSSVIFRYSLGKTSLADLLSDNTIGYKVSDPSALINMRITLENPDAVTLGGKTLRFDAAHNGGSTSANAATGIWYSDSSFDKFPGGAGFEGTLTDLLAAYGNDLTAIQMGFDLGPNLVQAPFVLHELKIGNQTILFDLDIRDLTVNYMFEGNLVGTEVFSRKDTKVFTQADLTVPAGYTLKVPFADHTVTANQTFVLELQAPAVNFDTEVRYEDTAGKVVGSGETITKAKGSTITKADLTAIPAGYELVEPGFSYSVTAAGTLVVKVQQAAAASYEVTVHYTVDGKQIAGATQTLAGLAAGSELTEADLKVPAGYRLVDAFAKQVVNSDLELSLPVELIPGNGGTTPGDTGAGKPGGSQQLSNTGGDGIVPALALAGGLGVAGLALTLIRRRAA